ncbi:MAG TPA: hypothetical protein VIA98_12200 [Allosphingosinicella sp.]|jgi:hypothetical protein
MAKGTGAGPEKGKRAKAPAGRVLRASGARGPQIGQTSGKRWNDAAKTLFLDVLANGSTYSAAADACGFSRQTIFIHRREDPRFEAECDAARAQGVARLDQLLIAQAEAALEGRPPPDGALLPPVTLHDAIEIVKLYRQRPAAEAGGHRRRGGWQPRPRTLDEVRGSILGKLSAIARSRGERAGSGGAYRSRLPEAAIAARGNGTRRLERAARQFILTARHWAPPLKSGLIAEQQKRPRARRPPP